MIQVPHNGEAICHELNCQQQDQVEQLRLMINPDEAPSSIAVQLLIVPDVSPVTLKLLGHELEIDYRVFLNHLWTQDGDPFALRNNYAYSLHTSLQSPADTFTVDCDVNVCVNTKGYVQNLKDESFAYRIAYRKECQGHVLRPHLTEWPDWLSSPSRVNTPEMQFYGTSRITVHHLPSSQITPTSMSKI